MVLDTIEAEPNPHEHPDTEQPPEDAEAARAKRRLKIELRDLKRHGFSDGCPTCALYQRGRPDAAKKEHHTEGCRSRIYAKMKASQDPTYVQVEQSDAERLESRAKGQRKGPAADAQRPQAEATTEPAANAAENSHDLPEPMSAEEGIAAEDTSFMYGPDPQAQPQG